MAACRRSARASARRRLLKGIVDRDGNHPSIVIWTIINENWGVDLVHDAEHRAWLKPYSISGSRPMIRRGSSSTIRRSRRASMSRADHRRLSLLRRHSRQPSRLGPFRRRTCRAGRDWLFSPEGDAVITGRRAADVLGVRQLGPAASRKICNDGDGREPWWFETGHDWGEGVMYAAWRPEPVSRLESRPRLRRASKASSMRHSGSSSAR